MKALTVNLDNNPRISSSKTDAPSKFLVELYTNGTYAFKVANVTWLESSHTWMRANGALYDNYEKSLNLTSTWAQSGADQLGSWQSINYHYQVYNDLDVIMDCSLITYNDIDLVRFKQVAHILFNNDLFRLYHLILYNLN